MRKTSIFAVMVVVFFSGCAVTGATIVAYTAGAVTVAANIKDVVEIVEETKEIRSGGKAPLPCEDEQNVTTKKVENAKS